MSSPLDQDGPPPSVPPAATGPPPAPAAAPAPATSSSSSTTPAGADLLLSFAPPPHGFDRAAADDWHLSPPQVQALPHGAPPPPPPAAAAQPHAGDPQPPAALRLTHPIRPNALLARLARAAALGISDPSAGADPSSSAAAAAPSASWTLAGPPSSLPASASGSGTGGGSGSLPSSFPPIPRFASIAGTTDGRLARVPVAGPGSGPSAADPTWRWGRVMDPEPMDVDPILGGRSASEGGGFASGSDDDHDGRDEEEDEDEDDEDDEGELAINWHADPLWAPAAADGGASAVRPSGTRRTTGAAHAHSTTTTAAATAAGSSARSAVPRLFPPGGRRGSDGANGDAWMESVWGMPPMIDGGSPAHVFGGPAYVSEEALRAEAEAHGYMPQGRAAVGAREQRSVMMAGQKAREERALGPAAKGEQWVEGRRKTTAAAATALPAGDVDEAGAVPELPAYLQQHPLLRTSPTALALPTHFSPSDHSALLAISSSGFTASYLPLRSRTDRDAASVRSDLPIPPAVGLFYFEVTIVDAGQRGYIGVGLSARNVNLGRLPGWERGSWGFHGDDGMVFGEKGQGREFGPGFTTGDVIGCGLDVGQAAVFYTKNGVLLGHVFHGLSCEGLYPTIGLRTPREEVRANFGQFAFRYDIAAHFTHRQTSSLAAILSAPAPSSSSASAGAGPARSASFRPPARALSALDRKALAGLEDELRAEKARAEDGDVDWNTLSRLQRGVWDLRESTRTAAVGGDAGGAGGAERDEGWAAGARAGARADGKRKSAAAVAGPSGSTAKAGAKAGKAGAGLDGRAAASSSASSSTAARTGAAGQDTDAVRALVGQYLAHQGFGSTLAALQRNSAPASPSASASTLKTSLAQAPVILDRRVRHLIVGGDLDGALALLDERYPRVAASAAGFRLKCARLVRMVIDASRAEAAATSSSAAVVVVPTSSAPLSKKRKASAAADGEHGLPPGKAFRSSAQPGASPSTSPPVQLGLPLLPPLAAAPTATAAATAEADEDATDKILAYARSLSALCAARPSPVGTVKAKALADADDLLGACLGLLAFPSLGSPAGGMPDKAVVGEAGAAAFRLQTAAGLEEIADRIDDRLLDAEHAPREPDLAAVVRHTAAVHGQMADAGLGAGAFVDVGAHLGLCPSRPT